MNRVRSWILVNVTMILVVALFATGCSKREFGIKMEKFLPALSIY